MRFGIMFYAADETAKAARRGSCARPLQHSYVNSGTNWHRYGAAGRSLIPMPPPCSAPPRAAFADLWTARLCSNRRRETYGDWQTVRRYSATPPLISKTCRIMPR
jgi:hypothetical protein